MKNKKRKSIIINLSNRWLYTFIFLGILIIVGVGVYAVDTTKAWHPSDQIDFSTGITTPNITTDKVCIGSDCKTSFNKAVYSITNDYCDGKGSLTISSTCLTRECSGTNNCGGYTFYPHYQCDGDCGFCCTGSCQGINTCPNTLQGYLIN